METSGLTRQILTNIELVGKKLKDCEDIENAISRLTQDNDDKTQQLKDIKKAAEDHQNDLIAINKALIDLEVDGVSGGKSVHKRRKNKRKTLRRRNKKGKK